MPARASSDEPGYAQTASSGGWLAASSHDAYLFGLLHPPFCQVSTEVHDVDPEQGKVLRHLRALDLLRQESLY